MPPFTAPQTSKNIQAVPREKEGRVLNQTASTNEVMSSTNKLYSFNRVLSRDQLLSRPTTRGSSKDFSTISTQTTITKLNAEIAKLRAGTIYTKAELEEQLLDQRKEMLARAEEEEENLLKATKQLEAVRNEIKSKEEYIRYMHRRNDEKDEEIQFAEQQRIEIQKGFDELSLEYENLKVNVDMVDGEISTLLESMSYLLRDQENIVESSLEFEKKIEDDANKRIERLQEMLEAEIENKKKSSELRMIDSGRKIIDTILEQRNGMKTVVDALSEDRYNKDDGGGDNDILPSPPKFLSMN